MFSFKVHDPGKHITNASLTQVKEGVYYLSITTKEKHPEYNRGSGHNADGTHYQSFHFWFDEDNDGSPESVATVELYNDEEDIFKYMEGLIETRYGVDSFLVDMDDAVEEFREHCVARYVPEE